MIAKGLAILLLAGVGVAATLLLRSDDASSTPDRYTLQQVSASVQKTTLYDFEELAETGESLQQVAAKAQVSGAGEIVDVVDGYTVDYGAFADEGRDLQSHILFVIKPDPETLSSDVSLGESGLIYVDQPSSPLVSAGALSDAVAGPDDGVLFFLGASSPDGEKIIDEFKNRNEDDPLFNATHASSLFGLDAADQSAWPLFTGENLEESPENFAAVERYGVQVTEFTVAPAEDAPLVSYSK